MILCDEEFSGGSHMAVIKQEFLYRSSVGDCDIHAISWKPKGKETPKAVIQIVHGMAEYIDRYDSVARYFAEHGYAVYGNDHLGHGQSVNENYPLGYFGESNKNGTVFVEDSHKLTQLAKQDNPGIPFVLFGHSMGSFVSRAYLAKYGYDLDAAVICGTSGPISGVDLAIKLAEKLSSKHGKEAGNFLNKLAFSTYNLRTQHSTPFDWLSKDTENVRTYINDPLCGFCFSNRGFYDLFTLNKYIFSDSVIHGCPVQLPLFFIAGSNDPVGAYGKGVKKTAKLYKKAGVKTVKVKLYKGSRHEIHNDIDKVDVYNDIIHFIDSTTGVGKGKKH